MSGCSYDDLILPIGTLHNESTGAGCEPGGTVKNGTECKFIKPKMFNACGRSVCVNNIWRQGFVNTHCIPCVPQLDPVPPLAQYEDAQLFPLLLHPVIDHDLSKPNCSLEAIDINVLHSNEAVGGTHVHRQHDNHRRVWTPNNNYDASAEVSAPHSVSADVFNHGRRYAGAELFPSHQTLWPIVLNKTTNLSYSEFASELQWLQTFPEWPTWAARYYGLIQHGKKFSIMALTPGKNLIGRSNVTISVRTPIGVTVKHTHVEILPVNDPPTINPVRGTAEGERLKQLLPGQITRLDLSGLGPGGGADELPQTLTISLNNTNETVVNATMEYAAILDSFRRDGNGTRRYDTLTHSAVVLFETKCTGAAVMYIKLCDADSVGTDDGTAVSNQLLCTSIDFDVVVQPVRGASICREVGWDIVIPPEVDSDTLEITLLIILLLAALCICCCCCFLFCCGRKQGSQLFVIGNPVLNMLVTCEEDYLENWSVELGKSVLAKVDHAGLFDDLADTHDVEYIAAGSTQISARVAQAIFDSKHAVAFAGCVGEDKLGQISKETSEASGMEVCFMTHEESTTNRCAVMDVAGVDEVTSVSELSSAANYTIDDKHIDMVRKHAAAAQVVYSAGFFQALSPETVILLADETGADDRLFCLNLSDPVLLTGNFFESMLRIFPYTDIIIGNEIHFYTLCDAMCSLEDPQGFHPDLAMTEIAKLVAGMHKVHDKRDRMVVVIQEEFESPTIIATSGRCNEYPGIFCKDFVHRPESLPFDDDQCPRIVSANGVADAFVGGFLAKLCLTQKRWHMAKSDWDWDLDRIKEKAEELKDEIKNRADNLEAPGVLGNAIHSLRELEEDMEQRVDQAVMHRSENSRDKDKALAAKIQHEFDQYDLDGDGVLDENERAMRDLPRELMDAANHAAWVVREGCFLNEEDEEWPTDYETEDDEEDSFDQEDAEDDMLSMPLDKLDKGDILFPQRQQRYRFEEESVEYEEHGVLSPAQVAALRGTSKRNVAIPTQLELEDIDVNYLDSADRGLGRSLGLDDEPKTDSDDNWFDDQI